MRMASIKNGACTAPFFIVQLANSLQMQGRIVGSGTVDERFKSHAWKACEG